MPVFAFYSARVVVGGVEGLAAGMAEPLTSAIIATLVLGKQIGFLATTRVLTRLPRVRLDPALRWVDLLDGIGFTVSLLVAELSFGARSAEHDQAKVTILTASLLAAGAGATVLAVRNRGYRRCSPTLH